MATESSRENRVWHSGPPPHVGWWNASAERRSGMWRWWDGSAWSYPAWGGENERSVALHASARDRNPYMQSAMQWSDYWPEDARVERVNPATGEVTGPTSCPDPCSDPRCACVCKKVARP